MALSLAACAITGGGSTKAAAPILFAPRTTSLVRPLGDFYPDASLRAREVGQVVLHFHIGDDGWAKEPFEVDVAATEATARLIYAAQKMFRATRYEAGERFRHDVTGSVVFEIMPCGKIVPLARLDYYYHLCNPRWKREPNIIYDQFGTVTTSDPDDQ